MSTGTRLVTAEELLRDYSDQRCELINGEVILMSPSSFRHGYVAARILHRLMGFVEDKGLGVICGAETGFILSRDPDTVRAPDAAFVRIDRDEIPQHGYLNGPPDLAVEGVSPDDRVREVDAKARFWIEKGTRLVWVLWPQTRSVTVYRPKGEPQVLHDDDALDGEDVLPGFSLRVGDIFG